jgi:hypothetical protein
MSRPFVTLESQSKNPNGAPLSQPQKGSVYGAYLYWNGELWASENSSVHLGAYAGESNQSPNAIAIGANSGYRNQGLNAVAIGTNSGFREQRENSIAIGYSSGNTNQSATSIAIGYFAGSDNQDSQSIAIGQGAGYKFQGHASISIGINSGQTNQASNSIAIGQLSGSDNQGINSIAIGQSAGSYAQGANSIAVGYGAGATSQAPNSIILNASSLPLNTNNQGLYVSSIRGPLSSSNVLSYNTATNEIYYNGSSERYKYDIETLSKDTSVIYDLQPREFKYNMTGESDIGLIAEEAFECDPAFAYLDKDQIPEGIQWNVITTYLIAEVKKLKTELTALERG